MRSRITAGTFRMHQRVTQNVCGSVFDTRCEINSAHYSCLTETNARYNVMIYSATRKSSFTSLLSRKQRNTEADGKRRRAPASE